MQHRAAALAQLLKQAGCAQPTLVLDHDALSHNLAELKRLWPRGKTLRIVDKSLPCLPLMDSVAKAFGTQQIMSFHLPVAIAMQRHFPNATIAFGKPIPAAGAERALAAGEVDLRRTIWLVDTLERIDAYDAMATRLGQPLRLLCEVDIGLHRGGFASPDALGAALARIRAARLLHCDGLLGYEAHISHMPPIFGGAVRALGRSARLLADFAACLAPDERSIINCGGSTTALLYDDNSVANELSIGSACVMPSDFDRPCLATLQPALFIATPILKAGPAHVPGPAMVSRILRLLRLFPAQGCYLYGGKWMAQPLFPPGMKTSGIIGLSSNQQFMALPSSARIAMDDIALFRPTQSEALMQHFGAITVIKNDEIAEKWPVLPPQ